MNDISVSCDVELTPAPLVSLQLRVYDLLTCGTKLATEPSVQSLAYPHIHRQPKTNITSIP